MACDASPSARERVQAGLIAFGPWLVLFFSLQALGRPADPVFVDLPFERGWPVLEWTEILYASGYLFTPLGLLLSPSRAALRQFVATGLVATLVVGILWVAIPVVAAPRPFVPETACGRLLAAERAWSTHVAAFPSFHALWALIAADALGRRSRLWWRLAWPWAILIIVSCVTTGQHALLDVLAAAVLFVPLRSVGQALAAPDVTPFRLHKWYLDCVGEDGQAAIIYLGRLRLGPLVLPYVEALAIGPDGPRRSRRLSPEALISRQGATLDLSARRLGLAGRWEAATTALDVTLLESPRGAIRWRCHQSGGACSVRLDDGFRLTGGGYAEELEMTLPPWELPFRELRWGRFGGGGRSVVWIDWRHGLERRWLFVNGEPVDAGRVDTDRVEWAVGRLDIEPGLVIREARVGRTLAGAFAPLLPRRIGQAIETKWLSRALLHCGAGTRPVPGTVIHEVVRWP